MPEEKNITLSLDEAKVLFNVLVMGLRKGLPMGLQEMPIVNAVGMSLLNKIEEVEPKKEVEESKVETPKFEVVE